MPAFYINSDGAMVYYVPPPPRPPPPQTGTNAPGFKGAVATAQHATSSYNSGHGSETTALDDWGTVENIIAEQYRIALTSSTSKAASKAAVASLDKQYDSYFQDDGYISSIYNQVAADGKGEAEGESTGMRKAQIQLFNAYNEPASSTTQSVDIVTASINVELQTKFGDGNDGAYTSAQISAAAAAVDKQFGSAAAPFVNYVAATMEGADPGEGQTLNGVLSVLQTKGLTLTPAEIKSGSVGGIKLTPAEIKSGTLILTPGEAQLAKIDPVTLAFLMADGITVTQLSQPMAQLAKENPALFSYMEINGVNITISAAGGTATPGHPVFSLGKGSVLQITLNGTPITDQQLPSSWSPSDAATNVVGLYLGSEASSKGSGVVQLANMLLPQLQVNPKTLSIAESTLSTNPATLNLVSLASLMQYADGARSQYVNGQLTTLLAAAPGSTSSGAAGYISGKVNPFLSTQLNGFFSTDAQLAFWNNSPAVAGLQGYLQTGLAAPFQSGNNNALSNASTYLTQVLSGASPEEAKMLIGLVESQVDNLKLNTNDPYYHLGESRLLTALSEGVQIADQLPGAAPDAEATQVAGWLNSSQGVQLLNYSANTLYDVTAYHGNFDLANALVNSIYTVGGGRALYNANVELGGVLSEDVQNGEQYYTTGQQKHLGATNYAAFEHNKAETLAAFQAQFSNVPGIGTKIKTANTSAVRQAIINANGFTPVSSGPGKPAKLTPQQNNIVNLDLSWIQSQSDPGATVTILPFLFASSTVGMQNGVFFDISNPNQNDPRHPSQVLIDGSAAEVALTEDPTANKHPNSVDVRWHYSSYRDFQLNNELYQGGTIYTLLNNPLGIGANGEASSGTDFHKEFDGVMNFVANEGVLAGGIILAPFTGGTSLAVAGLVSLAWNTYTAAYDEYDLDASHGEHFGWSNPNTRWDIVGDAMLAVNYLSLGAGIGASGFTRIAGQAADMETTLVNVQNAMAALPEGDAEGLTATVSDADAVPEGDTVPTTVEDGNGIAPSMDAAPGLTDALNTLSVLKSVNSDLATGLNWVKTGSEVVGSVLGGVQTGYSIYSTAANWDTMSWNQRLEGLGNIGMGFLPLFIEPMTEKFGEFVSGRNADSNSNSDENDEPADDPLQETNSLNAGFDPTQSISISAETQTEDDANLVLSSFSVSQSTGGDPPEGHEFGTGVEGGSPQERQALTDQFNTHLQNVSDALQSSEPATAASLSQRWLDVIVAAREFGAAQRLDSIVTDSESSRTAALEGSKSKLDSALDRLARTNPATDSDCTQAGCGGQIDSDGFCNQCGMSPTVPKDNAQMISEIRAALPNTDEQNALLTEVYGGLIQGPGGTYVQDSLTGEQFADSYVFLPDEVFEKVSSRSDKSQHAFVSPGSALVVVREGLGASDFADYVRDDSQEGLPVATVSTAKSILAHEAGHLITLLRNPAFQEWSRTVSEATGFNPEEAISELNAWHDFGVLPESVSGSGFPYAHSNDQVIAALGSGNGVIFSIYRPETIATEYLYQRAGQAVYRAQSDGNEEALALISPQEYRDAGENLTYTARYGGDPAATAIVSRLAEGPVARFYNAYKSKIDQGGASNASGLPTDLSTRSVSENSSGAADESSSSDDFFPGASPQAQAAFETLLKSSGGQWTTATWNAVNDYVTAALRSPDPELRAAAQNARDVLGNPTGDSPRFILSADDAEALGTLIAADIAAMQRANAGIPVAPAPAIATVNSPVVAVSNKSVRQGDTSTVTSRLARINGDATDPNAPYPLFGNKKSDREQLATTQSLLENAGYDDDVQAALATYLPTLPRSEGLGVLSDLNELSPDEHRQIQNLTTELTTNSSGMSNPAEFSARLLVDLAGLAPDDRQQLLDNGQTLLAPPQQWQSLADFINGASSGDDAAVNAHQTALLLSLPQTQDRGAAIDAMTSLIELENESAPGPLSKDDQTTLDAKVKAHVNALADIASTNNVPARLVESFGVPSASPLDAAISLMPVVDGVRELPSSSGSAYDSAGKAIAGKINTLLEANKARKALTGQINGLLEANPEGNSPPGVLHILLDAGDLDNEIAAGLSKPSASGPVATAMVTASLRTIAALGKKAGVNIEVTLATNFRSKPVLKAAIDAVGAKGVSIVDPLGSDDREAIFNRLNPDVYVSIGQSDTSSQVSSFLELASKRPETTTFAISDGTDAGGAHALGVVDYPLTASTVETGAQALVAKVLHELGSTNVPLWEGPTWKAQVKPTQVRAAYTAAIKEGAELDDGRFSPGTADGALTLKSLVGASSIMKRAIDSTLISTPQPDTWREQLVQGYAQRMAAQGGVTLSDYAELLSRAAPGNAFDKSVVATKGLFHLANTANRNSLLTLGGLALASTMGLIGMKEGWIPAGYHGDYETLLATLGTVPRQLDIIDRTLLGKWGAYAKFRHVTIADDQNLSQVKLQRRSFWSDVIRTATYPVTGAADWYSLATTHATTFAGYSAHGAEILLLPVVGWLEYVYLRKLGNTSIDAAGKFTTDLNSNLKPWEVKANQYGAYGGFSGASAGLILSTIQPGAPYLSLPYLLIYGRSFGNFGQTWSAWREQITGNKPEKLDATATIVGSGSIIVTQIIESIPGISELGGVLDKDWDQGSREVEREVANGWGKIERDLSPPN